MSKKRKLNRLRALCCLIVAFFIFNPVRADGGDVLNRNVKLKKQEGNVYDLLEEVSKQIGYYFIYDSDLIKNGRKVKLKKTNSTVLQTIHNIVKDTPVRISVVGHNILIVPLKQKPVVRHTPAEPREKKSAYLTFEGRLLDKLSKEPVEYGILELINTSITGVTNQEGKFRMTVPDSLKNCRLRISQLGYSSKEIELSLFEDRSLTILLEPKIFSVSGFIVKPTDPVKLLRAALDSKDKNYQDVPTYVTSFYREGIKLGKKLTGLTEAVIKIYKSPSNAVYSDDQVKLLKMRQIKSEEEEIAIKTKLESGIGACLQADILKDLPDFLNTDLMSDQYYNIYEYKLDDIIWLDDRQTYVISFEPHKNIKESLFCGKLYLDAENSAIVQAEYEIAPKYVRKMSNVLVTQKSRDIRVIPKKIAYMVRYKLFNDKYYLSFARGDLIFKVGKRKRWFTGVTNHVWFEMVACETDTRHVRLFNYSEAVPTTTVFSDAKYTYDDAFWGNFNVIPIEDKLYKAIHIITEKVKEITVIN